MFSPKQQLTKAWGLGITPLYMSGKMRKAHAHFPSFLPSPNFFFFLPFFEKTSFFCQNGSVTNG
jgi:hypothetical protein